MVRLTTNIFAGPVVTSALNLRQIVVLCITSLKYLKGDHALLTNQSDEQFVEAMETVDLEIGDIELRSVASPETTRLALAKQYIEFPEILRSARMCDEWLRR